MTLPSAVHLSEPSVPFALGLSVRLCALVLLAWCLIGCGSTRQTLDASNPTPFATGRPLNPAALARDAAASVVFVGDSGTMRIERDAAPSATRWSVRRFVSGKSGASSGAETRVQRFELQLDGSVALAEQLDRVESVEVVFDPPMVVLPAGLSAGQQRVQDLTMTVHPLGDRSRVRSRGPLVHRVTYVGEQNVSTPFGQRSGMRITSSFQADLSPAKVENESEQIFVEGLGLVYEEDRERTKVLGVPIRNNRERWAIDRVER